MASFVEEHKKEVETITTRRFTREHKSESVTVEHKSAITDHANQNDTIIDSEGAKVIERKRTMAKSIKRPSEDNTIMNRGTGGNLVSRRITHCLCIRFLIIAADSR